jgi:preprotein translocase subunit SecY
LLKEILIATGKVFALLPGAIATLATLRKIAEETGFKEAHPEDYEKLSTWINTLLYVLVEYLFEYIVVSLFGGAVWVLLVVKPKKTAKREFDESRRDRLGE